MGSVAESSASTDLGVYIRVLLNFPGPECLSSGRGDGDVRPAGMDI